MRKNPNWFGRHPLWTGIIFFFVFLFVLGFFSEAPDEEDSDYFEETEDQNAGSEGTDFFFYDKKTNCTLNGEIYVDYSLLGKTEEGLYFLTASEYREKFKENSTILISGETENCSKENSNLPFASAWTISDLQYNIDSGEKVIFEAEITPRQPGYPVAMQGFIRPEEVDLASLNLKENTSSKNAVNEIFSKFYMSYANDFALFGEEEYWQTPQDLVKNRAGDCEDWAITMVSLVEAHNSSIDCYLARWDTHMNMICKFEDDFFGMFDQDKIKTFVSIEKNPDGDSTITQENKVKVRGWLGDYFDSYGLDSNERVLYSLINSKEIILFEKRNDFVDWIVENER